MYSIIIANAPDFDATPFRELISSATLLIAADGGGNALAEAGLLPHLVIGDLDSLTPERLTAFAEAGAEVLRFPPNKDETDLELALLAAAERGAGTIDVLGGLGGRWDQSLSNVFLLALPELVGLRVRLLDQRQELYLVRGAATIAGLPGETVSLLPIGGPAHGITTRGLEYPLSGATLSFERSRGISNVLLETNATVEVATGLLLVVHHFSTDPPPQTQRPE